MIRKKNGTWQFVIELGKDPQTGKRKRVSKDGFKTRKDCQTSLAKIMTDIDKGLYFEINNINFKDFLNKYLSSIQPSLSLKTYKTYLYIAEKHLIPNLGAIPTKDLKPLHIQDFYNTKLKVNSSTTVRHFHNFLNVALNQAVKWKVIGYNPCNDVKKPRRAKIEMLVLNECQLRVFLDRIKSMTIYLPVAVAAMTGMRQGEICGLKWENVDLENKILYIRNQLQTDGETLQLVALKTANSIRNIELTDYIVSIFETQKSIQESRKKTLEENYKDEDYVITQGDGRPYTPDYIARNFYRVMTEYKVSEQLSIPRIRFHDLRHTHATLLLKSGANPKVVAERLGDTVSTVMKTYAHVLPGMQKEAIKELNKIFKPNDLKSDKNNDPLTTDLF